MDQLKRLLKISFYDFCKYYPEHFTILIRNSSLEQKRHIRKILDGDKLFSLEFVEKLDIYICGKSLFLDESFAKIIPINFATKLYHITDNRQILNLLQRPVNIHFFDDDINVDEYEIPGDFVEFMDKYLNEYKLIQFSRLSFFQTDVQQKSCHYYEFQNYLPFMFFAESIKLYVNVNKLSDDYGKVVLYDSNDDISGFYELYEYQKFMHIFKKLIDDGSINRIINGDEPEKIFTHELTKVDDDVLVKSASKLC